MKDFVQEYKKKNITSNISIITLSFVLALGLHFSLKDNSFTKQIKWNILESTTNNTNTTETMEGDIYLHNLDTNMQVVTANTDMTQVKKLSLSLSYNSENLKIKNFTSLIEGANIENISNEEGFYTLFVILEKPLDIKIGQDILQIHTEKYSEKTEFINMINVNYTDINGANFPLTTSWVNF